MRKTAGFFKEITYKKKPKRKLLLGFFNLILKSISEIDRNISCIAPYT
jgi:hypothetical protein